MSLQADVQSPTPGTLLELFVLDLNPIGQPVIYRFFSGVDVNTANISFGGNVFVPWPIAAGGFKKATQGPFPRPELSIGNATGYISSIIRVYDDLVGAEVRRIRTVYKYTDNGSSPDPSAAAEDVYYVNRRKAETDEAVVFELVTALDLMNKKLPGRVMVANTCPSRYKGPECGWPGTDPTKWFDRDNNQVFSASADVCSQSVTGCKRRFGEAAELPYGGFSALGRS